MAKKKQNDGVPSYDAMMIPTLEALKKLGGSGSIDEIYEEVVKIENYNDEVLEIPHKEVGMQTEIQYRLAWARTYLKKGGLIDNSSRGVWALVDNDIELSKIDPIEIVKFVRGKSLTKLNVSPLKEISIKRNIEEEIDDQLDWKDEVLYELLKIEPSAFERLTKRLLRESGFTQVEVTGKTGDGGIDGRGIARINGILSFHILFQCKRFKGSVGSGDIRDFRGAMTGRADKGLFITTGNFTRDAIKEAARDGAPPIDLIDGDQLCDKLKECNLGVETKVIEQVIVDPEWFSKV